MIAIVFISTIAAQGAPAWTAHQLGRAERYSFDVSIRVSTASKVRFKLLVPKPQSDTTARVEIVEEPDRRLIVNPWTSPDNINRWWVTTADLAPQQNFEFAYRAVITTRSIAIDCRTSDSHRDSARTTQPIVETGRYLTPSEHTGKNWAEARGLAKSIIAGIQPGSPPSETTPAWRKARAMYDAVIDRLDYDSKVDFSGAQSAWDRRCGQCCDYVAAFVALCRAAGIPARAVAGFYFQKEQWQMHVWAEFFDSAIGWIPCDPSLGDNGPVAADRFFAATDGRRVAVTRDLDLPVSLGDGTDSGLVQQYLFRYTGRGRSTIVKPTIRFEVHGKRLADVAESDPKTHEKNGVAPP